MPRQFESLAERQAFLDDFGVPITINGVTANCHLNDSDDEMAAETSSVLVGRGHLLRAAEGAFPNVAQGSTAIMDGVSYRVVSVRLLSPGGYQRIVIAKV